MNKNYKDNLKKRDIKETKKNIDFKEYKVKSECILIDFLMKEIGFSRNNAKKILSHHLVSVDGAPVSQFDFSLFKGDTVIIAKRPIRKKENNSLKIIYEDDEIIVINKPYGVLSVASDKEKCVTAYRMVTDYVQQKDKHNRVFVVHRIDKETSGVLMFAKNNKLKEELTNNWNELVQKRGYYAVCEGVFKEKSMHIENYLKQNSLNLVYITKNSKGAQKAITDYKVIKENDKYSLVDVDIKTGRKNQIRVTLGSLGHYILGDDKYGEPANPINRLCLHAYELKLTHPLTKKTLTFKAPIPKEFLNFFKN